MWQMDFMPNFMRGFFRGKEVRQTKPIQHLSKAVLIVEDSSRCVIKLF